MAVDPARMLNLAEDFLNGKMSSGYEASRLSIEEMDALLERGVSVEQFKKIA